MYVRCSNVFHTLVYTCIIMCIALSYHASAENDTGVMKMVVTLSISSDRTALTEPSSLHYSILKSYIERSYRQEIRMLTILQ